MYSPILGDQIYQRKVIDLKLICTDTDLNPCHGELENWNPEFLDFPVFSKGVLGLFTTFLLINVINPSYHWFSHLWKGFVAFFLITDTFISILITCWGQQALFKPIVVVLFLFSTSSVLQRQKSGHWGGLLPYIPGSK